MANRSILARRSQGRVPDGPLSHICVGFLLDHKFFVVYPIDAQPSCSPGHFSGLPGQYDRPEGWGCSAQFGLTRTPNVKRLSRYSTPTIEITATKGTVNSIVPSVYRGHVSVLLLIPFLNVEAALPPKRCHSGPIPPKNSNMFYSYVGFIPHACLLWQHGDDGF